MFQNANPRGVAAGWLHYLAFDFWVGCWMLKDSQKKGIRHIFIILPMLFTFMLGPTGILIYTLVLLFHKKTNSKLILTTSFLLFSLAVAVGFGALGSFIASKRANREVWIYYWISIWVFGVIGLLLMKDHSKNDQSQNRLK